MLSAGKDYTVQFEQGVYVLHAFQKKSKSGIATPKKELTWFGRGLPTRNATTKVSTSPVRVTESCGNDCGPRPAQSRTGNDEGAPDASDLPHHPCIKQPHVSLLMRNGAGRVSTGRLMEFLTALGQDVEVPVRSSRKEHGEMSVQIG